MIHVLGPFRLVRQLGQGGFAPVWLAEEIHDGKRLREVALKLFFQPEGLDPAEAAVKRDAIIEEARALCRVEHPNVVRFYSLQRDDSAGVVGMAMECVAGTSLAELAAAGQIDERAAIEAGIDVAWALAAVHGAGLVHRDVKPGNIVRGATGHKLIDFGIVAARPASVRAGPSAEESPLELAPTVLSAGDVRAPAIGVAGTPGYIAPECFHRGAPASPESDLYALGATLFKLLARVLPGEAPPRLDAVVPAGVTAAFADLVARLLAADPAERPRHADEVARELQRIRAGIAPAPEQLRRSPSSALRAGGAISKSDAPPPEPCARPPLVGREAAIAVIDQAAGDALRGSVRVVLFSGPLGVGRTRLLEAAVERAGVRAGRVLSARCSPERKSPLRPLLRALEAAPRDAAGSLDLVRDAIERALSPGAPPGAPGESEALEAVEDALLWASADDALVLALDDLQWGDAQTLGLLRLLIERADAGSSSKLLVLLAARAEPSPTPPLRALLGAVRGRVRPGVRHVPLGPLGQNEALSLCRSVAPVAPEVERAALRGSGGVPFFVVHALLGWREEGAIVFRSGAYQAADERVPLVEVPGVADLLDARLSTYFDETGESAARAPLRVAEEALGAVALYGGGLARETLARVCGAEESLDRALETLVAAGILTVSGDAQEYGFAQEMVRQAALNWRSARPWFPRLHRALLDTVASQDDAGADAEFLATGYEKLGARDLALRWLDRAIGAATGAGRFGEAVELGDRRIALTSEPEGRAEADLDVVRALLGGRRFEEAKRRLVRREGRSPSSSRAAIRSRIYRLQAARGLHEPDAADRDLVADADAHGDAALSCEARMALAGVSSQDAGIALAGEAVAIAERAVPALEFSARVLRIELVYASDRRDLAIAERDLERCLAIAESTSSPWQQIHVEGDLAVIEAELGRLDAAVERMHRLIDRAEAMAMRGQVLLLTQNLAAMLLGRGAAREAAEAAERAASMAAAAGDPALQAAALSLAAEARRRAGDLAAALRAIAEADALQRARDDRWRALTLLRRAEILAALGRDEEALADARESRVIAERHGERDLVIGAGLWEVWRLARRRAASPDDVERKVMEAEASGVSLRALTRGVIAQAKAWLAGPRLTLDEEPSRPEVSAPEMTATVREDTRPPLGDTLPDGAVTKGAGA